MLVEICLVPVHAQEHRLRNSNTSVFVVHTYIMRNQRTWARVSLEETDIEDSFRIGQVQPCEVRLVYLRVCNENRIFTHI